LRPALHACQAIAGAVAAGAKAGDPTAAIRHRLGRVIVPRARLLVAILASALLLVACEAGPPPATPPIFPGSAAAPREVNVIAKDWQFLPDPVDFIAGETVLLHLVNGGLEIHEVVIGDATVQDAWEAAEAAVAEHPPGPTPIVSVPPDVAGIRIVVASGQRVDLTWTVPADAAGGAGPRALLIGCHIPRHWAKGMVARVRIVQPSPAP
jgi:uncharacterized cupredoxin-like copper-binding protein